MEDEADNHGVARRTGVHAFAVFYRQMVWLADVLAHIADAQQDRFPDLPPWN